MKYLLIASVALILIAGVGYQVLKKEPQIPLLETPTAKETHGTATFSWSYRTFEEESILYTELSLMAVYEDGTSEKKIIDTVEGSCNSYEDADSDIYERSTMVICYYAGLGHYFKVVAGGNGYEVQRRIFEEASPDYDPPQEPYVTVGRF